MTEELDGLDQSTETGGVHTPAQDGQEHQESQVQQPRDYSKDFDELKTLNQKAYEEAQAYKRDLMAHKEELAKLRDQERKRNLLLLGDQQAITEEQEKRRQEQIKNEFFKVFPHAKQIFEGQGGQSQGGGEHSLAEKAFFNSTRQKAMEMAKGLGFPTTEGQEAVTLLGEILVNITPTWKERFYSNGDLNVLNEVSEWMNKAVFEPYAKAIEAKTIERIKKQGRYSTPVPPRSGGSGMSTQKDEKINPNNPNDRRKAFSKIFQQISEGAAEE